jgi:hypothetical protein
VTLILRPFGRGNWQPVRLTVEGRHAPPMMLALPGQRFVLGGTVYRVVARLP